MKSVLGVSLLVSLALAAGCASNELRPFESIKEVQDIATSTEPPMRLSLAVAPIRVSFDDEDINREGTNRWAVRFDPRDLRTEFVQVLQQYEIFEKVEPVEGATIGDCIDNAFKDELDVVMELDLKEFDVSYEGVNGWYAPNLINFALFVWTAWWVADEVYAANVEMEMSLYSAHSGQRLLGEPLPFKKKVKRELDDFERGWKLTGSIFIPGGLRPENWQKIHDVVMPFTLQEVKKEMLVAMHGDIRPYSVDQQFADLMAKRMALVIGVNRHENQLIHNLRYADADARAFTEFLTDPWRGDVPEKNVRPFENHTATLQNVRESFQYIEKFCRPDDTVYVYFAGYGAVVKDEEVGGDGYRKYLILYDTEVDDLANTALSVEELDELCDRLDARNVVIIMDTSFNQGGETRTYVDVRKPPEEVILSDDYLKLLADGPGRVVIAACAPDQGALMLDEEQQGLLTHYLMEGTLPGDQRKQIVGDDGILTLQEIVTYAIPASEDRADVEGLPQIPLILGEGAEGIELFYVRADAPPSEEEVGEEPLPTPEEDAMPDEEGYPADDE